MRGISPARFGVPWFVAAILIAAVSVPAQDGPVDFDRDIRPIFLEHCVKCHGVNKQKAGLRLDRRAFAVKGGESRKPILGGTLETNPIYLFVTETDPDKVMPKEGRRLNEMEVALIRRWVEQKTPWPDEEVFPEYSVPLWVRAMEFFQDYFDQFIWPILPPLSVLLLLILIVERCKGAAKAGRWGSKARRIAQIPRSWLLVALLALFLFQSLRRGNKLAGENARLSSRGPVVVSGLSIEGLYGSPPVPYRPAQPLRLGGEYYRGNCERNPKLFNNGNYRTATFRLSLHDGEGRKLEPGDALPDEGLQIRFEIERAPSAAESLFSPQIMSYVFLTPEFLTAAAVPAEKPAVMKETNPGNNWVAFYAIPKSAGITEGDISGLVYVYKGSRDDEGKVSGECHYAIKYDLVIKYGHIADRSDMWVGNVFWHNGIAAPQDPKKVPFDQWFSSEPIPEITGENTTDPKLLGIEDYRKDLDREAPKAPGR